MNLTPAPRSRGTDLALLAGLAAVMAATRLHHFAIVPDASWAVFFVAGFHLRRWAAWAFPLLMALAVVVDYVVITAQGQNFWAHYCVSPGYWMLVPAYFSLWAGGAWLSRQQGGAGAMLGKLAIALVVSVALCQLFAQGGFYWMSDVVAQKSLGGWSKNYFDWLGPYLLTTSLYVGAAVALHVAVRAITGSRKQVAGA